jgi:Domain of unknown function (DUF4359)
MTRWQIALLGIFTLCGLAATNPSRAAYENYAIDLVGELGREQCDRAPGGLGVVLQAPCRAAIESFKPKLRPLLAATSRRQNFFLFSLYKSELAIPGVNFNLNMESIGICNNFFTYKAQSKIE